MNLRQRAEADLGRIMENSTTGFGWPITVTDPAGTTANLTGLSNDISQMIDPETGQAVSGRLASVALRISSLALVGLGIPKNVADATKKPWIVTFNDIQGKSYTFKVIDGNPDRGLGLVTCTLEHYENG